MLKVTNFNYSLTVVKCETESHVRRNAFEILFIVARFRIVLALTVTCTSTYAHRYTVAYYNCCGLQCR